ATAGNAPQGRRGHSSEDASRESLRPAAGESDKTGPSKILVLTRPRFAAGALFVRATGQTPSGSRSLGQHPLPGQGHRARKLSILSFKDPKNSTIQKIC